MALVKCRECGNEISNMAESCPSCGAINKNYSNNDIPEEYEPITMWGYVGYEILFSIPLIGLIVLCIYAFGATRNINLKNFARSYFCTFLIIIVLIVLLALLMS